MPTVPQYTPREQPRGFGGERTTLATGADFGADVGEALSSAGRSVATGARFMQAGLQRRQDREDADDARRAFADYEDQVRVYLNDPNEGVYTRRGRNARGAGDEAAERIDAIALSVGESLESEGARRAFEMMALQSRDASIRGVDRHERQELETSEIEGLEASLRSTTETAASSYTDTEAVGAQLMTGDQLVKSVAVAQGWTIGRTNEAIEAQRSRTHAAVIERMIVDSPEDADAYLKAHKDELSNEDYTRLAEQASSAKDDRFALQEADRIVRDTLGDFDPTLAEVPAEAVNDMLAQARNSSNDPGVRDEVGRRVTNRIAQMDAVYARDQRRNSDQAWELHLGGTDVAIEDPKLWYSLPAETKRQIIADQDRLARGEKRVADPELIDTINRQVNEDRDAFLARDLNQDRGRLDDYWEKTFLNLQRTLGDRSLKAAEKAERDRVSYTHTMRLLDLALLGAELNPAPKKDTPAARRIGGIRNEVWKAVSQFQQENQRQATDEELRAIFAQQLQPVRVRQVAPVIGIDWMNPDETAVVADIPRLQAEGVERSDIQTPEGAPLTMPEDQQAYDRIPKPDRDAIEAWLRQEGQSASPSAVVDLYDQFKQANRQGPREDVVTGSGN